MAQVDEARDALEWLNWCLAYLNCASRCYDALQDLKDGKVLLELLEADARRARAMNFPTTVGDKAIVPPRDAEQNEPVIQGATAGLSRSQKERNITLVLGYLRRRGIAIVAAAAEPEVARKVVQGDLTSTVSLVDAVRSLVSQRDTFMPHHRPNDQPLDQASFSPLLAMQGAQRQRQQETQQSQQQHSQGFDPYRGGVMSTVGASPYLVASIDSLSAGVKGARMCRTMGVKDVFVTVRFGPLVARSAAAPPPPNAVTTVSVKQCFFFQLARDLRLQLSTNPDDRSRNTLGVSVYGVTAKEELVLLCEDRVDLGHIWLDLQSGGVGPSSTSSDAASTSPGRADADAGKHRVLVGGPSKDDGVCVSGWWSLVKDISQLPSILSRHPTALATIGRLQREHTRRRFLTTELATNLETCLVLANGSSHNHTAGELRSEMQIMRAQSYKHNLLETGQASSGQGPGSAAVPSPSSALDDAQGRQHHLQQHDVASVGGVDPLEYSARLVGRLLVDMQLARADDPAQQQVAQTQLLQQDIASTNAELHAKAHAYDHQCAVMLGYAQTLRTTHETIQASVERMASLMPQPGEAPPSPSTPLMGALTSIFMPDASVASTASSASANEVANASVLARLTAVSAPDHDFSGTTGRAGDEGSASSHHFEPPTRDAGNRGYGNGSDDDDDNSDDHDAGGYGRIVPSTRRIEMMSRDLQRLIILTDSVTKEAARAKEALGTASTRNETMKQQLSDLSLEVRYKDRKIRELRELVRQHKQLERQFSRVLRRHPFLQAELRLSLDPSAARAADESIMGEEDDVDELGIPPSTTTTPPSTTALPQLPQLPQPQPRYGDDAEHKRDELVRKAHSLVIRELSLIRKLPSGRAGADKHTKISDRLIHEIETSLVRAENEFKAQSQLSAMIHSDLGSGGSVGGGSGAMGGTPLDVDGPGAKRAAALAVGTTSRRREVRAVGVQVSTLPPVEPPAVRRPATATRNASTQYRTPALRSVATQTTARGNPPPDRSLAVVAGEAAQQNGEGELSYVSMLRYVHSPHAHCVVPLHYTPKSSGATHSPRTLLFRHRYVFLRDGGSGSGNSDAAPPTTTTTLHSSQRQRALAKQARTVRDLCHAFAAAAGTTPQHDERWFPPSSEDVDDANDDGGAETGTIGRDVATPARRTPTIVLVYCDMAHSNFFQSAIEDGGVCACVRSTDANAFDALMHARQQQQQQQQHHYHHREARRSSAAGGRPVAVLCDPVPFAQMDASFRRRISMHLTNISLVVHTRPSASVEAYTAALPLPQPQGPESKQQAAQQQQQQHQSPIEALTAADFVTSCTILTLVPEDRAGLHFVRQLKAAAPLQPLLQCDVQQTQAQGCVGPEMMPPPPPREPSAGVGGATATTPANGGRSRTPPPNNDDSSVATQFSDMGDDDASSVENAPTTGASSSAVAISGSARNPLLTTAKRWAKEAHLLSQSIRGGGGGELNHSMAESPFTHLFICVDLVFQYAKSVVVTLTAVDLQPINRLATRCKDPRQCEIVFSSAKKALHGVLRRAADVGLRMNDEGGIVHPKVLARAQSMQDNGASSSKARMALHQHRRGSAPMTMPQKGHSGGSDNGASAGFKPERVLYEIQALVVSYESMGREQRRKHIMNDAGFIAFLGPVLELAHDAVENDTRRDARATTSSSYVDMIRQRHRRKSEGRSSVVVAGGGVGAGGGGTSALHHPHQHRGSLSQSQGGARPAVPPPPVAFSHRVGS